MEMKHTPGPWQSQSTAGHDKHGQSAVYAAYDGKDIAIIYDGAANAKLIAAAPEMLDALRALMGRVCGLLDAEDTQELWHKLGPEYRQAKSAIAKAEGR